MPSVDPRDTVWQQAPFFWQRTLRLLGDEAAALFAPPDALPPRGLTVNTRLLSPAAFAAAPPFAVRPSGFAPANFVLTQPQARPGRHAWHHAGVYYVQEPSASAAAGALDIHPGQWVLDMCAAPGGKTAQLAAALAGQGVLVANEYDAARSRVLLSNCERMGAPGVVVLNEAPERLAAALGGRFDRVLVDAPCSGEGMFRKQPQALMQHSPALVAHCAALQAQILAAAAACVAAGGELVYSTCTFSPEEDEGQIGAFLAAHPDFQLVDTGLAVGVPGHENHCVRGPIDVSLVRRIYPCHGGEGHFVARLRRTGAPAAKAAARAKRTGARAGGGAVAAARAFLREQLPELADMPLAIWQDGVYLPPAQLPALTGLHVLRCGVQVGTQSGGRFVPAHHLTHAFGGRFAAQLALDAPAAAAYLCGQELPAPPGSPAGWCAVLTDGFALGLGKVSAGRLKNHYPRGLRETLEG